MLPVTVTLGGCDLLESTESIKAKVIKLEKDKQSKAADIAKAEANKIKDNEDKLKADRGTTERRRCRKG